MAAACFSNYSLAATWSNTRLIWPDSLPIACDYTDLIIWQSKPVQDGLYGEIQIGADLCS